jgi:hypothetical protein
LSESVPQIKVDRFVPFNPGYPRLEPGLDVHDGFVILRGAEGQVFPDQDPHSVYHKFVPRIPEHLRHSGGQSRLLGEVAVRPEADVNTSNREPDIVHFG